MALLPAPAPAPAPAPSPSLCCTMHCVLRTSLIPSPPRSIPIHPFRARSPPISFTHSSSLNIRGLASDDTSTEGRRGEKLWRKELQSDEETILSLESRIEHDVQRLTLQREAEKKLENLSTSKRNATQDRRKKGFLTNLVEKLLIADFFFIVFILGWFLAGLAEKAAFDTFWLIDAWLPLWPIVFQPALGLFMAAAIFTALSSFFSKR